MTVAEMVEVKIIESLSAVKIGVVHNIHGGYSQGFVFRVECIYLFYFLFIYVFICS